MRVLVTGGAGFVGSHLIDHLVQRGDSVVALDDLSTGRIENLDDAFRAAEDRLTVVQGDVCDRSLVDRLTCGVDAVVHLAAAVGVERIGAAPLQSMRTNIQGVDAVLEAAGSADVPVVLASSSEVYGGGDAAAVPFDEADSMRLGEAGALRAGYACAKAYAECAATAHAQEHSLRAVIVRLFNTVGPRQRARYGMVLPRFVDQALAGTPLTVFGDGTQTRCFAHVRDVVRQILGLLEAGAFGRAFNVGDDRETRIVDLARRVVAAVGSASELRFEPFESAHPGFGDGALRRVPALQRMRAELGAAAQPQFDLDALIRDVVSDRARRRTQPRTRIAPA